MIRQSIVYSYNSFISLEQNPKICIGSWVMYYELYSIQDKNARIRW